MDNCGNSTRSLSRSAGASLPSVNSAAFNNPAAISLSRGLGIETIHYGGESQVGIITGTGRVGAAISNFPNDGTFFGNSPVEDNYSYRMRKVDGEKFKEDKLVLAGGFNLFGAKQKKGIQADVGLMYRKNNELDESFYGGGLTISINKFLSFGYASYNDVHYKDLRNQIVDIVNDDGTVIEGVPLGNSNIYLFDNRFSVYSYTAGLKFSNIAFDYIKFITKFEDNAFEDKISSIYNISYFYKTWIFSYGRRLDEGITDVYEDKKFILEEDYLESFIGAQYAANGGFIIGGFYNYYLLNELSVGLTYFF